MVNRGLLELLNFPATAYQLQFTITVILGLTEDPEKKNKEGEFPPMRE